MSGKAQSLMLHVLAWAVLALVVTNIVLAQKNRAMTQENARQQKFVQGTVPLDALNKEIVKALAELSVKNQDEQLRTLLASNGITFNLNPPAPNSNAPAVKK